MSLAFDNLKAVLKAGGCGFEDNVDVTTFHTDPANQFETIMAVRERVIGKPPYPTWTAVGVTWLSGFDFEIKVIARRPHDQRQAYPADAVDRYSAADVPALQGPWQGMPTSQMDARHMTPHFVKLPRVVVGSLASLLLASPAFAQDAEARLAEMVSALEAYLDARIGVLVRDSGSDWHWGHRAEERFLMASTFKSVLCSAVLDRVAAGMLALDDHLDVRQADILDYAPVTEAHVCGTMPAG